MATTIEIKGGYSQKTEIFGKTLSHHTGTFDIKKPMGAGSWSQPVGPGMITESVKDAEITVSVSAFGQSLTLFSKGIVGHNQFKIELDSGNFVKGTVLVTND